MTKEIKVPSEESVQSVNDGRVESETFQKKMDSQSDCDIYFDGSKFYSQSK